MGNFTFVASRRGSKVAPINKTKEDSALLNDLLKMKLSAPEQESCRQNLPAKSDELITAPVQKIGADARPDPGSGTVQPALSSGGDVPDTRARRRSGSRPTPNARNIVITQRRGSLLGNGPPAEADLTLTPVETSDHGSARRSSESGSAPRASVNIAPQLGPIDFSNHGFALFDERQSPLLTPVLLTSSSRTAPSSVTDESEDYNQDTEIGDSSSDNHDSPHLASGPGAVDQYHQEVRRVSEAAKASVSAQSTASIEPALLPDSSSQGSQRNSIEYETANTNTLPTTARSGWRTFATLSPTPTPTAADPQIHGYFDQLTASDDASLHEDHSSGSSAAMHESAQSSLPGMIREGWQGLSPTARGLTTPRGMPNHPLLQQVALARVESKTKSSPKPRSNGNSGSLSITDQAARSPKASAPSPVLDSKGAKVSPLLRAERMARPGFASRKSRSMVNLREPDVKLSEIDRPALDLEESQKAAQAMPPRSPIGTKSPSATLVPSFTTGTTTRRLSLPSLSQVCPDYYESNYYTTKVNRSTGRTQQIHARPDEGTEVLPMYTCDVHMEGWAQRKMEFTRPGQPAQQRPWKRIYVYLHGPSLKILKGDPRIAAPAGDRHPYRDFTSGLFKTSVPAQNISIPRSSDREAGTVRGNGTHGSGTQSGGDREKDTLAGAISHIPLVSSLSKAAGGNSCIRHYSLQNAESGLAADYHKRKHVVRVRAEGEQFLLQVSDDRNVVEWIEALQGGTNISKDLDFREQPKFITLPRRRRRRAPDVANAGTASATPSSQRRSTRTIAPARPTNNPARDIGTPHERRLGMNPASIPQRAAFGQSDTTTMTDPERDTSARASDLNHMDEMLAEEQNAILSVH